MRVTVFKTVVELENGEIKVIHDKFSTRNIEASRKRMLSSIKNSKSVVFHYEHEAFDN